MLKEDEDWCSEVISPAAPVAAPVGDGSMSPVDTLPPPPSTAVDCCAAAIPLANTSPAFTAVLAVTMRAVRAASDSSSFVWSRRFSASSWSIRLPRVLKRASCSCSSEFSRSTFSRRSWSSD